MYIYFFCEAELRNKLITNCGNVVWQTEGKISVIDEAQHTTTFTIVNACSRHLKRIWQSTQIDDRAVYQVRSTRRKVGRDDTLHTLLLLTNIRQSELVNTFEVQSYIFILFNKCIYLQNSGIKYSVRHVLDI